MVFARLARPAAIARRGLRRPPVVVDPPEAWERPARPLEVSPILGAGRRIPHPFRPATPADVPSGALEALAGACGVAGPGWVLVAPSPVRPTTSDGQGWVIAPDTVLGIGTTGIAAWVDAGPDGGPGVRATIEYAEMAALEDERILLHGRARFIAASRVLSFRYSTVARQELASLLLEARRGAAGAAAVEPLPPTFARGAIAGERAWKWARVARSETVALWPGEPAAVVLGETPGRSAWRGARPTLVAITAHELVVAREPEDAGLDAGYGVESLSIPRRHLEAVAVGTDRLTITAAGATMEAVLGRSLSGAVGAALGDFLPGG